jgi:hypothetical protein
MVIIGIVSSLAAVIPLRLDVLQACGVTISPGVRVVAKEIVIARLAAGVILAVDLEAG